MAARYFELGGVIMWPLLACSVLLVAVLFERLLTGVVFTRLLRRRVTHVGMNYQHKVLQFLVEIPPSIGLLGTVVGVVQSFNLTNGRLTAETAAAGLGVACFTTVFGLTISIIASVSSYILAWLNGQERWIAK